MDPHTYAKSSTVYGAMAYPLIDDWELIERELQNSPNGSYALYRSTEAQQQQQEEAGTYKDTMSCFEVCLVQHACPDVLQLTLNLAGSLHFIQRS